MKARSKRFVSSTVNMRSFSFSTTIDSRCSDFFDLKKKILKNEIDNFISFIFSIFLGPMLTSTETGGFFALIISQFYIQLLYRPHFGPWLLPFGLLVVMSPSRAGSSHSSSWRIFSSAGLVTFFTSARMQNRPKTSQKSAENEPKFDSQLKAYFFINFHNKLD